MIYSYKADGASNVLVSSDKKSLRKKEVKI